MNTLSPDYKRDIERLFSRREDLAYSIYKGSAKEYEEALNQVSELTKISLTFLKQHQQSVKRLAFVI